MRAREAIGKYRVNYTVLHDAILPRTLSPLANDPHLERVRNCSFPYVLFSLSLDSFSRCQRSDEEKVLFRLQRWLYAKRTNERRYADDFTRLHLSPSSFPTCKNKPVLFSRGDRSTVNRRIANHQPPLTVPHVFPSRETTVSSYSYSSTNIIQRYWRKNTMVFHSGRKIPFEKCIFPKDI